MQNQADRLLMAYISNFSKNLTLLADFHGLFISEETIELFKTLRGEEFTLKFLTSAMLDIVRLASLWEIQLETVLHGGVQSLCFKGYRKNGIEVVLKVPSIASDGLLEMTALKIWGNSSTLKILEKDPQGKGFLMGYIENIQRPQTLKEILAVAEQLHTVETTLEVNSLFPPLEYFIDMKLKSTEHRFINSLDREQHNKNLELAKNIFVTLVTHQKASNMKTLLHGDMKSHNLLSQAQGVIAIDPQPCVGDPLYDIAMWIAGSVHQEPIDLILLSFSSLTKEDNKHTTAMRLFLWTWALAVVENRPHHKPYAIERQDFIDNLYDEAALKLESFII